MVLFLFLKTRHPTSFLLYFSFIFFLTFLSSLQLQTSYNSHILYTFIDSLYILPYLPIPIPLSYIYVSLNLYIYFQYVTPPINLPPYASPIIILWISWLAFLSFSFSNSSLSYIFSCFLFFSSSYLPVLAAAPDSLSQCISNFIFFRHLLFPPKNYLTSYIAIPLFDVWYLSFPFLMMHTPILFIYTFKYITSLLSIF